MPRTHKKCPHGRQRSRCKECKGSSFCPHDRQRRHCKECKGSSVCEHDRIRSTCRECKGSSICEHNRRRDQCVFCRPEGMYKIYIRNEKNKKGFGGVLPSDFMSLELFCELVKKSCMWCGASPKEANGMGIDRIDNEKGHVTGNLEPCCSGCNMARGSRTHEEFKSWLARIIGGYCVRMETNKGK